MDVLWRSDPWTTPVGTEIRIMDLNGDKIIEVGLLQSKSFWSRLVAAFKYLFGHRDLIIQTVITDDKFESMCKAVVK